MNPSLKYFIVYHSVNSQEKFHRMKCSRFSFNPKRTELFTRYESVYCRSCLQLIWQSLLSMVFY